jgi:hypothetical protein
MNTNELLARIFSLSRSAPPPPPPPNEMPFGLETAVLAHWREASARKDGSAGLLRAMRWAALTACAVALVAATLNKDELAAFQNRFDPETTVADSAISVGFDYE